MTVLQNSLTQLETIVGADNLLTATEVVSRYRLAGQQPFAVAFPSDASALSQLLKFASQANLSVYLQGAGKHLHLGAPPTPIGVICSLERLTGIIEHDAENLTITVKAGSRMNELQQAVAKHNQLVPLEPPMGDESTIGGVIAGNLSGPRRMKYGGPRDLVLGLRAILSDGTQIKAGGKTMKNVAGYELTKLFIGSFGSLGAITEVTLRLVPKPDSNLLSSVMLSPGKAREAAERLLHSSLEPASLDLLLPNALTRMRISLPLTIKKGYWGLFVGYSGEKSAGERWGREIKQTSSGGWAVAKNGEEESVRRGLCDLVYPRTPEETIVRIGVPSSYVYEFLTLLDNWENWWAVARVGDGLVYAGVNTQTEANLFERLRELRNKAEQENGYLVMEAGDLATKRAFFVWGEIRNQDIMQHLKERFDPAGILGCGRLISPI